MGSSADATLFFGFVITGDEGDRLFDDPQDAIDEALGFGPRSTWPAFAEEAHYPTSHAVWLAHLQERTTKRMTCPIDILYTGYEYDGPQCLAVKSSVQYALSWDVVGACVFSEETPLRRNADVLAEYANLLNIPPERRGPIGWHFFATYG